MTLRMPVALVCLGVSCLVATTAVRAADTYARDPKQPLDREYTAKIAKDTTDPSLNSPLTDYLPASSNVPTPAAVIGDIAGAPNVLPHSAEVYEYFRLLASKSPRVKVFTIGKSEEGREMIAVAVADESLLAARDANDARLAKLADPRTIRLDDAEADRLVAASTPVYYITGTIHSPETGAPTALMELAYRLAVDDAPYIRYIRSHVITLITPIVEVDGRDRMADLYAWHRAHPGETVPRLVYWGHYVAHDNNRDAMGMTLNLTRNVLDTYLGWHAQVLHDLHESVPFLYDNTVGDGPYNAWIDPILANEWQLLGWDNVQEMTKLGMPGVFTHGTFDTWSPGYLMFLAAMHNGVSRLYETFGNGGADTEERILDPDEYQRTWYKQNPPLPKVLWSQRDNNNYEETALLTALHYYSENGKLFLKNFYLKAKRSIEKPANAGPAAYVFPGDDPRAGAQAELLRVLQLQHCEVMQTTAPITVPVPPHAQRGEGSTATKIAADEKKTAATGDGEKHPEGTPRTFPAGSFVVRMDQPYSRIADALLDRQYWAPEDPQKHPYDDTGWSFGDLFDVEVVRVSDPKVLAGAMRAVRGELRAPAGLEGGGPVALVENHAENAIVTLRYALPSTRIEVADAAFDAGQRHYAAGTLLIRDADRSALDDVLRDLGLRAQAVAAAPDVASHPLAAPRVALLHTWIATQEEGWWRMTLDRYRVPYDYISTQDVARESDLRSRYDAILFGPVGWGGSTALIVNGLPMWGNALPWKKTDLTPNLGRIDSTDDMRPGLGLDGLAHLRSFVEQGGLLVTSLDTAQFAIDTGLAPGISVTRAKDVNVVGSVLRAKVVDATSPVVYGVDPDLAIYSADGMSFTISNSLVGDRRYAREKDYQRPTGRGGPDEEDLPQGRAAAMRPKLPEAKPWEALPLNVEETRNNPFVIPEALRPQTIVRFGDADGLLVSGLLEGGHGVAQHAAVAEARLGSGHVLLFASDPIYRGETIGTYPLVWNALLNFDHLDPAPVAAPAPEPH